MPRVVYEGIQGEYGPEAGDFRRTQCRPTGSGEEGHRSGREIAVVFGAHQQLDLSVLPLFIEHLEEVGFAVAHVDQSSPRQLRPQFNQIAVVLDPRQRLLGGVGSPAPAPQITTEQISQSALPHRQQMKIYQSEIWHTYTSYLRGQRLDLHSLAHTLVEEGVAAAAMHRDGKCVWACLDGSVAHGEANVQLQVAGTTARVTLPSAGSGDPQPEPFAQEALYQAAHFRFNEMRVLSDAAGAQPGYVRAAMGVCHLCFSDAEPPIRLYPVLIVYETGVVVVELRATGPDDPVDLEEFVSGAVNLFRTAFNRIEVPPGLAAVASEAYINHVKRWKLGGRLRVLRLVRDHRQELGRRMRHAPDEDFPFKVAPLSSADPPGEQETLAGLALSIMDSVRFLACRPRRGISFLLRGQRPSPPMGIRWTGRPHIFLIDFEGRCDTADENLEAHASAFASILSRVDAAHGKRRVSELPSDTRAFQDYNSFVTKECSLWVWSSSGVRQQEPWADANRGQLIYEHQAMAEMLEYGYMIHLALLEASADVCRQDEVIARREQLLEIESQLNAASNYGELVNWLHEGWSQMGLDQVRIQTAATLDLQDARLALLERRRMNRVGWSLSILFGLAAVPALAQFVVTPVWGLLELPRPASCEAFALLTALLTFGLVALLLLCIFWACRESIHSGGAADAQGTAHH